MRTVAIIQARMGSTRLPGKVLQPIAGMPMLALVVRRVSLAKLIDEVVVATTTGPEDDEIEALARVSGWAVSRGSQADVLDRYVQTARHHRADVVVRITSDCPLIDAGVIDGVIAAFGAAEADYASNTLPPRTYPRGLDVEVVEVSALERAWREDADPALREHVTPYIYRHPEIFRLLRVPAEAGRGADLADYRWTVDTPEDLELVRRIYAELPGPDASWLDALSVIERHPELGAVNSEIVQKVVPG